MRRDLERLSRRALLALPGAEGTRGRHRLKKAELVDALVEAYRRLAESPQTLRSLRRDDLLRLARAFSVRSRSRLKKPELAEALLAKWVPWRAPGQDHETRFPLPSAYGKTRMTLMAIDPYRAHAYWEIVPADLAAARQAMGRAADGAATTLRIYDVTAIIFDGTNAWHSFDVEVGTATNWYLGLWSAEKSLVAELGLRSPMGRFVPLARSNVIHTPRAGPSNYEPEPHVVGRWEGQPLAPRAPIPTPLAEPGPTLASPGARAQDEPGLPQPSRHAEGRPPAPAKSGGVIFPLLEHVPDQDRWENLAEPREGPGDGRGGIPEPSGEGGGAEGPWAPPGLEAWRQLEGTWATSPGRADRPSQKE